MTSSNGANERDLISELPDCVLSCILSCLPTKEAVQTSLLSKAWEDKWTSVFNVEVDDYGLTHQTSFMNFMDRRLSNSQNIREFKVTCSEFIFNSSRIERWLSALFRRNVQIVNLEIIKTEGGVILPRSLLTCSSLRELEVDMACTWKVPMKICYTNLTCLYLEEVVILNDNPSNDILTFTLPKLVTLGLRGCKWRQVRSVDFQAPCLISFLSNPLHDVPWDEYHIKISGAFIDNFKCGGINVENFDVTESTVCCAHLSAEECGIDVGLRTRKLLTNLSSISEFKLSGFTPRVIGLTNAVHHHLPKFIILGRMELSFGTSPLQDVGALVELLHAAPALKDLVMVMGHQCFISQGDGYDYDSIGAIPSCVVSQLKTIKFTHLKDNAHHLRLAMFMLEHGAELKEVSFSKCLLYTEELGKKILALPKASSVRIVISSNT